MARRFAPYGHEVAILTDKPSRVKAVCDAHPIDVRPFIDKYGVSATWCKFALFMPSMAMATNGYLYIDLDNVILRDLTHLTTMQGVVAHNDWTGCFGAMAFGCMWVQNPSYLCTNMYEMWSQNYKDQEYGDDQTFINKYCEDYPQHIPLWNLGLIGSYKGILDDGFKVIADPGSFSQSIVICMHGRPNVHEVIEQKLPEHMLFKELWVP
jgi:hypothetical protein